MNNNQITLALSTFPNREVALKIATELVKKQYVACVNLLNISESIYLWQGELHAEAEVLGVFKTLSSNYAAFAAELTRLHPYETPELISFEASSALPAYLDWIAAAVAK